MFKIASSIICAVALASCLVGCSVPDDGPEQAPRDPVISSASFAAEVVPDPLTANVELRVQVGLFQSLADSGVQVVTYGEISVRFSFEGDGSSDVAGPDTSFTYLPAPETPDEQGPPRLSDPSEARGVYAASGVTFDHPGTWTAMVEATVEGVGTINTQDAFTVTAQPLLPAPGQRALRTQNLTMDSKVAPVAIDSRAQGEEPVPDPELHRWTIAEAIARREPALVLFATPVYCTSQFCGPDVEALQDLAERYATKARYIHVEIWGNYRKSLPNAAAEAWLHRGKVFTEPWLYLIGADGVIADRWGPLFDAEEVARELAALPDSVSR